MPVIVPKPVQPAAPAAAETTEAPITRADLQAALNARDLVWAAHLETMAKALIASIPQPAPTPPRKPATIKLLFDNRNNPIGATITPET